MFKILPVRVVAVRESWIMFGTWQSLIEDSESDNGDMDPTKLRI